ncbi:tryptophan 7-halogenase [Amycolatopsis sp. NPDC059235]|uniref:tryptophan 7-halogenase n=1 Tax=Amycolatopsis sp. NPDC059235 TaxID=3346782 RepID=UPI0036722275
MAVLGAGPAGSSTAIALRRAGCEVVLIDPDGSSLTGEAVRLGTSRAAVGGGNGFARAAALAYGSAGVAGQPLARRGSIAAATAPSGRPDAGSSFAQTETSGPSGAVGPRGNRETTDSSRAASFSTGSPRGAGEPGPSADAPFDPDLPRAAGEPAPPAMAGPSFRNGAPHAPGESVPPPIAGALARLGLSTAALDRDHLRSLGTASAWGAPGLRYRDYLHDGLGPGWHLDRPRFDRMLRAAAVAAGAVLVQDRWSSARRTAEGWSLTCHRTRLTADVVVDATGRRAAFGTAQGARRCFADRLVGVAATVPGPDARRHVILESAENGWWYASPQPGGRLTLALLSDADLVRREGWARPPGWLAALRETRHLDLPPDEPSLTVRDARSHLLTPSAGRGWIAAGDAAMALDPLSSAGVTLAIESGLAVADLIASGHVDSIRHRQQLRRRFDAYLRQRREVYRAEQRWESPFWTRRREGAVEARHLVLR